jgi:hypothetical protein
MSKKIGWAALAVALVGLALSGAGQTITGEIQQVLVHNFPEVQEVKGTVRVDGPIVHSGFLRREAVIVSPARRGDVTNLTPAGVIETAGFTGAVLSIEGEVRDSHFDPGTVGAVLVPDEGPVLDALRVDGRIEFPLEVVAGVEPQKGSRFSSEPTVRPIAFPRYRVFLYNGSNKSVEANLYVYLTN